MYDKDEWNDGGEGVGWLGAKTRNMFSPITFTHEPFFSTLVKYTTKTNHFNISFTGNVVGNIGK